MITTKNQRKYIKKKKKTGSQFFFLIVLLFKTQLKKQLIVSDKVNVKLRQLIKSQATKTATEMDFLGNQTEQRKSEKLENEQIGIEKIIVCIKINKNLIYQIRRAQTDSLSFYLYLYFLLFCSFLLQSPE